MKSIIAFFVGIFSIFSHPPVTQPITQSTTTSTPQVLVNLNNTQTPSTVSNTVSPTIDETNWKTYSNPDYGYSVKFPPTINFGFGTSTTYTRSFNDYYVVNSPSAPTLGVYVSISTTAKPTAFSQQIFPSENYKNSNGLDGTIIYLETSGNNPTGSITFYPNDNAIGSLWMSLGGFPSNQYDQYITVFKNILSTITLGKTK